MSVSREWMRCSGLSREGVARERPGARVNAWKPPSVEGAPIDLCLPGGWFWLKHCVRFAPTVDTFAMRATGGVVAQPTRRILEGGFIHADTGGQRLLGLGTGDHQASHRGAPCMSGDRSGVP